MEQEQKAKRTRTVIKSFSLCVTYQLVAETLGDMDELLTKLARRESTASGASLAGLPMRDLIFTYSYAKSAEKAKQRMVDQFGDLLTANVIQADGAE